MFLLCVVPSISVSITGSGDGDAVALRSYTLTCSVTAPATLDLTSPSYRWMRDGVVSGETGQTFVFTPLHIEQQSLHVHMSIYCNISLPYNNVDGTIRGTGLHVNSVDLSAQGSKDEGLSCLSRQHHTIPHPPIGG